MERRSLFDSIPLAYKDVRQHWRILLTIGAIYAGMNFVMQLPALMLDVAGTFDNMFSGEVPMGFGGMTEKQRMATFLQSGIYGMSTVVNAILWFGAIHLALGLIDEREVEVWDGICPVERVPFAIGWAILSVVCIPAYMCCILPGLALTAAFWQWPTAAIDQGCSAGDSLGKSVNLFRDNAFAFIGLSVFLIIVSVFGALFYFWASTITFPFSVMVSARAYRILVPAFSEE